MSRKQRLHDIFSTHFNPTYLVIEDETGNHSVPIHSESHFKVIMVSEMFLHKTRVARHRLVNQPILEEFSNGLHALSLHLFTPEEWQEKQETVAASPQCKGGSRKRCPSSRT